MSRVTKPIPHERDVTPWGNVFCGARTRAGAPCRQPGTGAGGRCRLHGGASLSGAASPSFRHGRYSRFLPARLLDRYVAAQTDPERLSLLAQLALLDARLSNVLSRVDSGETGGTWRALRQTYSALEAARRPRVEIELRIARLEARVVSPEGTD